MDFTCSVRKAVSEQQEKRRGPFKKKKKKNDEADWKNIRSVEFLMDHSAVWCYYGVIIYVYMG